MTYEDVTLLGTIAGQTLPFDSVNRVNDSGDAAGTAVNLALNFVPVVWSSDDYTAAPFLLNYAVAVGVSGGTANDVSSNGIACGIITGTGLGASGSGYRWANLNPGTVPSHLSALVGKSFSNAWGVNASNQVVGHCYNTGVYNSLPTLWDNSTTATQLSIGIYYGGNAYAISDSGIISGSVRDGSGGAANSYAVWWDAADPTTLNVVNPPTPNALVNDANNTGVLALYKLATQAYIYDGTLQSLTGGTIVGGISDDNVVAGAYTSGGFFIPRVWTTPSTYQDLTSLDPIVAPTLRSVFLNDISSDGSVVAGYVEYRPSGTTLRRAAVWTFPISQSSDVLSTIATIDHDLLIGVEEDQHHTRSHYLDERGHTGGLFYKTGVHEVGITDADFINPADGMIAVTYGTELGTGITHRVIWARANGVWRGAEA